MTTKICIILAEDNSRCSSNQVTTVEDQEGGLEFFPSLEQQGHLLKYARMHGSATK